MERMTKVNKLTKLEENLERLNAIMEALSSSYILDSDITINFFTDSFTNIYGYQDIPSQFNITKEAFIKTIEQALISTIHERDKMVKELYRE